MQTDEHFRTRHLNKQLSDSLGDDQAGSEQARDLLVAFDVLGGHFAVDERIGRGVQAGEALGELSVEALQLFAEMDEYFLGPCIRAEQLVGRLVAIGES